MGDCGYKGYNGIREGKNGKLSEYETHVFNPVKKVIINAR